MPRLIITNEKCIQSVASFIQTLGGFQFRSRTPANLYFDDGEKEERHG
jgi:hypothetical protein